MGRGGGTPRLAVATAGYLKIWNCEASLYSARKGPKQNLISSVGAIESRVASNSESRQVQWRGLVVGGWGARGEHVTQVQPITDLLCRKWGGGTSGDEAFPLILKSRGVAAELPLAWCPLGGDAGSRQTCCPTVMRGSGEMSSCVGAVAPLLSSKSLFGLSQFRLSLQPASG